MGEGAEHLGTHHRTWQYVFAGFALILAIASGAGGLLDVAVLAGIAGVIASALAGFQAKSDLSSGVLARRWRHRARAQVARRAAPRPDGRFAGVYGIPADFDPRVFVGHNLARVWFGAFSVHLEFSTPEVLLVSVVGSYEHAGPSDEGWTDSVTVPAVASRLMQLTNHVVVDAGAVDGRRLVIEFDHGHSLTLIDDNGHYEAFQIQAGERLWVI
jgi:hypothetical protein